MHAMTIVGDISRRIELRRKRHTYIREAVIVRRRREEGRTASFSVSLFSVRGKKGRWRRELARRGKAGRMRDERDARDHSPVNCLPPRRVPSSVMLLLLCSVLLLLLLLLLALLLFPPSSLFSFTVAHRQCHRLAHVVVPTKTSSTILHLTRHSAPVKQLNIILFKKTTIVAGLGEIDGTWPKLFTRLLGST